MKRELNGQIVQWLNVLSVFASQKRLSSRLTSHVALFAICYLLFAISCSPVFALEFDTSFDNDIRKNYNPTKIEDDMRLPALPRIRDEDINNSIQTDLKTPTASKTLPISTVKTTPTVYSSVKSSNREIFATLKQGTKIEAKLLNNISDRTKVGTKVSFVSIYPVSTTYYTIPIGTIFKGEIIESHKPGFTGNGGLIVLEVDSVILNGKSMPISAKVTKANSKRIFFNAIKGKRKYLSSMFKSTKPGFHFFRKMLRVTAYLASDGSSIVVAPFSLIIGAAAAAGNVIASPVIAVFYKGGSISINEGSNFELKLNQDAFIFQ